MAANYLTSIPALTKDDFKVCILFTEISLVLLSKYVAKHMPEFME